MLFNSPEFLFAFLPVALVAYYRIGAQRLILATWWLVLASIAFYAWWDYRNLLVLGVSMLGNFALAHVIARQEGQGRRRLAVIAGTVFNLALLGWFKYANFVAGNLGAVLGRDMGLGEIVLPLGISFFTFTQLGYLVDVYRRDAEPSRFVDYALFVTYFPHLISGPLLHHREMIPQFEALPARAPDWDGMAAGATMLAIGLFKKVVIADGVAEFAPLPFDAAGQGMGLPMVETVTGVLAYALQLYFDFSAYSDMAIGISMMLGIQLPINFDSPYKAASIAEFWRRWHMTLGRFLTGYLYVPLGGSRVGRWRHCLNLMVVMVLSGLWHGAGWTFVAWGALHGVYLVVHRLWSEARKALGLGGRGGLATRVLATGVTFLAVTVAWIFFRAASLPEAMTVLEGFVGLNGIVLPDAWLPRLGALGPALETLGITFGELNPSFQMRGALWVAALLAAAFLLPNSQQIVGYAGTRLQAPPAPLLPPFARLRWRPTVAWAGAGAAMAGVALFLAQGDSEFLYFQF
jgi:D-alanyl-lipoteichoic acid acyltransferase DltB (MBOAT superfamily)